MSPNTLGNGQIPTGGNDSNEWRMYKVREVAALFGCTSRWVTKMINQGRINAVNPFGGNWRIPPSEWQRLQRVGLPLGYEVDIIEVPQEIADKIFPASSPVESIPEKEELKIWFAHYFENLN